MMLIVINIEDEFALKVLQRRRGMCSIRKNDLITLIYSFLVFLENIPILRVSTVLFLIEQLIYHSLAILVVFLLICSSCECRCCRCNPSVTSGFCITN